MFNEPIRNIENLKFRKYLFLCILVMMSVCGLIGSDIYLPMLPEIGAIYGKTVSQAQLTLSIYLLGLSVSQLFYGPLTDKFGRKRIVSIGIIIYLISSISCALSISFSQLLISRFFQAVGACSGLVIGRAIISDIYDKQEAGKIFSTIFPFVGMSPAIAPAIGGVIGLYLGWRANFWFLALFCSILILLISFFLQETSRVSKSIHSINILKNYLKLLSTFKFWAYVFGPCFGYAVYFGYITESPFIFSSFGFRPDELGFLYISLSITYVIGNLTGKRMLKKKSLDHCLMFGYLVFVLGGGAMLITSIFHLFPLISMIIGASILTLANGFLLPLGTAGVVTNFAEYSGTASGLLGFLQLGTAAITAAIINTISHVSIAGLAYFIFPITILGLIVFTLYTKAQQGAKDVCAN